MAPVTAGAPLPRHDTRCLFLCFEPPKWLHEYFNLCASVVHMDTVVVVPDCSVEQNQGEDAAEPEQPGGGGPGHQKDQEGKALVSHEAEGFKSIRYSIITSHK